MVRPWVSVKHIGPVFDCNRQCINNEELHWNEGNWFDLSLIESIWTFHLLYLSSGQESRSHPGARPLLHMNITITQSTFFYLIKINHLQRSTINHLITINGSFMLVISLAASQLNSYPAQFTKVLPKQTCAKQLPAPSLDLTPLDTSPQFIKQLYRIILLPPSQTLIALLPFTTQISETPLHPPVLSGHPASVLSSFPAHMSIMGLSA